MFDNTTDIDRLYIAKHRKYPSVYKPKVKPMEPPFQLDYEEKGSPLRKPRNVYKTSPVGFF